MGEWGIVVLYKKKGPSRFDKGANALFADNSGKKKTVDSMIWFFLWCLAEAEPHTHRAYWEGLEDGVGGSPFLDEAPTPFLTFFASQDTTPTNQTERKKVSFHMMLALDF